MIETMIKGFVSSFFATLGFGILFNIKGKNLILASITGAIGGLVYKTGCFFEVNDYICNFLGAVGISICAEILARQYKSPVTTYLVAALIPLVPGASIYRMMLYAIRGSLLKSMEHFCHLIGVAASLAVGILIVSTIFRIYSQAKRKALQFRG